LAHFLCDTAGVFGFDHPDSKSAQPRDILRAVARADATAIFIIGPIEDIVAAVLNGPVAAIDVEDTLRVGFLHRAARNAVCDFTRAFAALFVFELPFDGKGLSDMRKAKVAVEFGGGPDLADFDAPMVGRRVLNEIGFLSPLKPERDLFENAPLIGFDGEVVMGLALVDQVFGKLALREERIGGHVLTLDGDGVEHGNGHFDLVGAFDLFAVLERQGPHFFWV